MLFMVSSIRASLQCDIHLRRYCFFHCYPADRLVHYKKQAQICADGCKGGHHLFYIGRVWQKVSKCSIVPPQMLIIILCSYEHTTDYVGYTKGIKRRW